MPNSPITALIIDDEQLAREELQYLLGQVGGVEVLALGRNGIEAVELVRTHLPDVLFLDVQMPGLDGFGVLKKLLERNKKVKMPQIVFATAFDQYAARAFEVNAIDYLLKPFDQSRVRQAVERVRQRAIDQRAGESRREASSDTPGEVRFDAARLEDLVRLLEQQQGPPRTPPRTQAAKIVLRAQSRLLLADQKEICYASIEEGTISVVTPTVEGHSNCRTLEELLELLDPAIFWRAHRSFVVNINHIQEVVPWFKSSYQLRMDDRKRTEIPVSRAQTKRLRELFNL